MDRNTLLAVVGGAAALATGLAGAFADNGTETAGTVGGFGVAAIVVVAIATNRS